jgi:large subunit ribosomal protein L25
VFQFYKLTFLGYIFPSIINRKPFFPVARNQGCILELLGDVFMTAKAIFELNAEVRHDMGKGASRRLRRTQDKVPAIIYGGSKAPLAVMLDQKKVMHALEHEAFYSHLLTLHIDGKKEQVVLKALQRHHIKKAVNHIDFLRVSASDHINMHVPLHFLNEAECPGVKAGGIVSHRLIEVELRCLATRIPEYIEVDLAKMALDQTLHLSQLKLPAGVEVVALSHGHKENDAAVVSVHLPRRIEEEPSVVAEIAETEVLPKGKEANAAADLNAPAASKDDKEKGKGK